MKDRPKLSEREWEALGKLLLPVAMGGSTSLGRRMAAKFMTLGLVEHYSQQIPPNEADPPWVQAKMRIRVVGGYHLTQRGQFLYCEWADEQVTEDRIEDDGPREADKAANAGCAIPRSND